MVPIEPVGVNPLGMTRNIAARATRPADFARPDAATGAIQPAATAGADGPRGIEALQEMLAQVLEDFEAGLDNGDILQALISLIILLAMLQMLQPGSQGSEDPLESLGAGGSGQPSALIAYTSSTTITIEQTTTIIAWGTSDDLNAAFGGEPMSSVGSRLDLLS